MDDLDPTKGIEKVLPHSLSPVTTTTVKPEERQDQKEGRPPHSVSLEPFTQDQLNKARSLPTPDTQDHTPLIPVPSDAPPFHQHTCDRQNKQFGCMPTALYPYHTEEGGIFGYVVRWDLTQPTWSNTKEMRPYLFGIDKNGKQRWMSRGLPEPRPLYNLQEIVNRPQADILIVEGEKTVEAAKSLFPEWVVTTSAMGSNAASKTDWTPLKGRNVIICPDFDKAGRKYGESVWILPKPKPLNTCLLRRLPGRCWGKKKYPTRMI